MCADVSYPLEASLRKFDADESRLAYLETRLESRTKEAAREQNHEDMSDMGLF